MPENDSTHFTRACNPGPISAGCVYRVVDVCAALRISKNTLSLWVRNGLIPCCPGKKAMFFIGSEIIEFLQAHRTLSPPTKRRAKGGKQKPSA